MSERRIRIVYWLSTGLLALWMAGTAVAYFTVPYLAQALLHLGFPNWFRYALGAGKALGAIALVAKVPPRMKTLAYDGLAVMFVCATIAHPAAGDPPAKALGGAFALLLLVVSCVMASKLREPQAMSLTAAPTER
jgi:hypothetical protein